MWYRSWPERIPAGRAHVVDGLPRLVMRDQNYATAADYQPWPRHEPGWFMLEWDIALEQRERARFAANALASPHRVRVAPYTLYPAGQRPRQVHRTAGKPIAEGDPLADMVGLGCIYFPQAIVDALWQEPPPRLVRQGTLTDGIFSDWHRIRYGKVDVDWTVQPQHLHGD